MYSSACFGEESTQEGMFMKFSWHQMASSLLEPNEMKPISLPSLPEVVEQARKEWLNAQDYYNTVSDEDLVDHAAFLMQAAEKKYMYLLKMARKQGITYSPYKS
jgi:hypothetical protein